MYTKLSMPLLAAGLLFMASCKKDTTPKTTVFVSTNEMTNITSISATGAGDVDLVGTKAITERGICWNTAENPTIDNNKAISNGSDTGHFTADLAGLTSGTLYYAKAYVINNGQAYYGNQVKFTASVPIQLIKNGDFELPADPNVTDINSVDNWKTDETDA